MTGKSGRGTARQTIRADEALWEKFGDATTTAESDRSTVLRDFMRWYVHETGARMPRRPASTGLPAGIHEVIDGVTTTNPRGRTWYVLTVDAPDHAVTAALVGAGLHGATVIPAGPRTQLRIPSRATAIRMYDALVVRGYRIVDEEPGQ